MEIDEVPGARLLLVLTHGSAGGVHAPDLLAVRDAAMGVGASVAGVTQAFRVAA
ncbi:alpha/beta hydrolase, partial [Nonomuraea deserti]